MNTLDSRVDRGLVEVSWKEYFWLELGQEDVVETRKKQHPEFIAGDD
jgi:hypothetical protein